MPAAGGRRVDGGVMPPPATAGLTDLAVVQVCLPKHYVVDARHEQGEAVRVEHLVGLKDHVPLLVERAPAIGHVDVVSSHAG